MRRFPKKYNTFGKAVRMLGGWNKYFQWLKDNPIRSAKIPRNKPCPCNSGKKYKKCCLATVKLKKVKL